MKTYLYAFRLRRLLSALIISGVSFGNAGPILAQAISSLPCEYSVADAHYPASALDNHIMGPVRMTVYTDENGGIRRLEAKGHPRLISAAEEILRSAHFSSGCFGRTIEIRFSFRLVQDLDPDTPVTIKTPSTGEYEIMAPLRPIEVTICDPAWLFSRRGRLLHRVNRWLSHLRFW